MKIDPALNHVNLMTHDMPRLIRFYGDILGFETGYRPPFSIDGTWLYKGGNALIHLVQAEREHRNEEPKVNHFAFTGTGLADFLQHLRTNEVAYNVMIAPEVDLRQVVMFDPDGNMFEVLFAGAEAEGVDISPFNWP